MKRFSFRVVRVAVVPLVVACASVQPGPAERDAGLGGGSATGGASNVAGGSAGASTRTTDDNPTGVVTSALSRCAGSDPNEATEAAAVSDAAPRSYCDAELISWSCSEDNPGLKLRLTRQLYHCCPKLSADLSAEGNTYRLTITDQRNGGGCDCRCVFDVDVQATGLPCNDTTLVFGTTQFPLPLSQSQGQLVVSNEPSPGCREARHEVSADTDADSYLLGEGASVLLRNYTTDTVYLPGCADHTVDQFDGTMWIESSVGSVECSWEGTARPVYEGTIYDTASNGVGGFNPPVGTWRACFDVSYGCLPEQPISKAECPSHEKVCTPSFTVRE